MTKFLATMGIAAGLLVPAGVSAQQLAPVVLAAGTSRTWVPQNGASHFTSASTPVPAPATFDQRDHRWEGAIAGFVTFAGAIAYLGSGLCEGGPGHDCAWETIRASIGGGILGGFLGFVVGGAIPKS